MTEGDLPELEAFARLLRGDPWAAADALAERFPEADYAATKANSGLYKALDHYAADLDRIGEPVTSNTLRAYRATALAWPHDSRLPSATFEAHRVARDPETLARYVKRAEREGHLRLGARTAKRYRAEERPTRASAPDSWAEGVERAIARAAKRFALGGVVAKREDWWTLLGNTERADLAVVLRGLASDIAP